MKLSDAIRLGSMLHTQAFRAERVQDEYGNIIATCALGAAAMAFGRTMIDITSLSNILNERISCPVTGCRTTYTESAMIVHLNDNHGWTRERIADWVETVEHDWFVMVEKVQSVMVEKVQSVMVEKVQIEEAENQEKVHA